MAGEVLLIDFITSGELAHVFGDAEIRVNGLGISTEK